MTAEEEFEKWWATELKGPHGFLDMRKANALYLAATKATAARCVEICREWGDDKVEKWADSELAESAKVSAWDALRCATAIKKEFDLE